MTLLEETGSSHQGSTDVYACIFHEATEPFERRCFIPETCRGSTRTPSFYFNSAGLQELCERSNRSR